ncbi:hypothetical protein J1TS5_10380 [Paenibacillus macerans]|uniref:hypothetical protein n=1 Tax=Paenibacillus macerans TaxID=44252 RepID=UPI001B292013|nr:hypothetical protein [Paenibacillus macerans]GIP08868.1 hypothetical protein J1TS5_10380 [Paenibacillus macerans]
MWDQVWDVAKYVGLSVSALLFLFSLVLLIRSAFWDGFNDFGDFLKGAAFWGVVVFVFYGSIFPQRQSGIPAIPIISNTFSSSGISGGSPPFKSANDSAQIRDSNGKVGFGNVGVSGFDSSGGDDKPITADTDDRPALSCNESAAIDAHYFLPNSGGNGYFAIAPGDRVETFIGEQINIDFEIPYETDPLIQLNDLAIDDWPTATNPNIIWISFTTVKGENKVSIKVDDSTYSYFFVAEK